jgi:hypothetical protein
MNAASNDRRLTSDEQKLLHLFRMMDEATKVRFEAMAAFIARVMGPGDSAQLYQDVANAFMDRGKRAAWELVNAARSQRAIK